MIKVVIKIIKTKKGNSVNLISIDLPFSFDNNIKVFYLFIYTFKYQNLFY